MKRGLIVRGLLFAFAFLVLASFLVRAAGTVDLPGVQGQVDSLRDQVDSAKDNVSDITQTIEDKKWKFLSEKWNEFFAKSPFFVAINTFMDKYYVNYLIFFLFGMKWEMSFTFWFIFSLWIWFFFAFSEVVGAFSLFSRSVSSLLSLGLVILLAQLRILKGISDLVFKVLFYKTGVWHWISFGLFILVMVFLFVGLKIFSKRLKKIRDKSEKEKEEASRRIINRTARSIKEGLEND